MEFILLLFDYICRCLSGVHGTDGAVYTETDRLLLGMAQPHLAYARRLAFARSQIQSATPLNITTFEKHGFTFREACVLLRSPFEAIVNCTVALL